MSSDESKANPASSSGYYGDRSTAAYPPLTHLYYRIRPLSRRHVPGQGITLTIGLFFDGTGNNQLNALDRMAAFDECSILMPGMDQQRAEACQRYQSMTEDNFANISHRGGLTNIVRLNQLYKSVGALAPGQTSAQIKIYISGIGTNDGKRDSVLGMGLGSSLVKNFQGVVTKTDKALTEITQVLSEFIALNADNPVAIAKIQFDIFGFSRGAASARHFANRVMKQDQTLVNAINLGMGRVGNAGRPAGEVRFLGLFETVAAIGSFRNFYDINGRNNPGVDLDLLPGVAQNVFQITAMHECRHNFSLNSIKGAWPELALPGVHSDIGGGYNAPDSDLPEHEDHLLTLPEFEIVSEDTREIDTAVYRKAEAIRKQLYHVSALKYMLPHGEVTTRSRSVGVWDANRRSLGRAEKQTGAAVFLKRSRIPNDWEKVSMRVMLDAAQEAGALFSEIQQNDALFSLPDELKTLNEKAIEQGRAVRKGQQPVSFTEQEIHLIGKYMHCSANWNIDSDRNLWVDPAKNEVVINSFAARENPAFVWPNCPGNSWLRTVWYMTEHQQWETERVVHADVINELF